MCKLVSSAGLAAFLLAISITPGAAGPWDGRYYPDGHAPEPFCRFNEYGTWSIRNDRLSFEEGSCLLTNPVDVRDMPGLLYDAECWGEGDKWVERVFVIRRRDGVEWITPTLTWRLKTCP